MSFYNDIILPRLCHLSMRNQHLLPYRKRVVAMAQGHVLEIGIGSGLNLPFYSLDVHEIQGLEPSPRLIAMARTSAAGSALPVSFIEGSAEAIPLDDHSIDTVVTTWTLCTIPQAPQALAEMRRVLKPGGQLLFVEHGLGPEDKVRQWQDRLTPVWSKISGGCYLNRPIEMLIEHGGFDIKQLETGYMKGPKPMAFIYQGRAVGK